MPRWNICSPNKKPSLPKIWSLLLLLLLLGAIVSPTAKAAAAGGGMMKKKKKTKKAPSPVQGNDKPTLTAIPGTPATTTIAGAEGEEEQAVDNRYRQNLCDRYAESFLDTNTMKHALRGLTLNTLIMESPLFQLDQNGGINVTIPTEADPSSALILPAVLDELATRAEFTWRTSFATTQPPTFSSAPLPWTKLLYWGVEHFDIYIHNWAQNAVREKKKVAFTHSWGYDASIIMIGEAYSEEEETIHTLKDWLRPFGKMVWTLTFLVIVISGAVDQILEFRAMKAEGNSWLEWKKERLQTLQSHLSSMSWETKEDKMDNIESLWDDFSETYIYDTQSPAGRVCGSSMVLLVVVMICWTVLHILLTVVGLLGFKGVISSTATGTGADTLLIDNLQQAIYKDYALCTVESTNADIFIRKNYPKANRILKQTAEEAFLALHSGDCPLVITEADAWNKVYHWNETLNPGRKSYAPVGAVVEPFEAGFAAKVDTDDLCSSLIPSVLNIHLMDMINDGFMDKAWHNHMNLYKNATEEALNGSGDGESEEDLSVNATSDASSYAESMTTDEGDREGKEDLVWWQHILNFFISPRLWWKAFRWCMRMVWFGIKHFFLFLFILLMASMGSYCMMISLIYFEHFLSGNPKREEAQQERGRSRTPKPVNNPYKASGPNGIDLSRI